MLVGLCANTCFNGAYENGIIIENYLAMIKLPRNMLLRFSKGLIVKGAIIKDDFFTLEFGVKAWSDLIH